MKLVKYTAIESGNYLGQTDAFDAADIVAAHAKNALGELNAKPGARLKLMLDHFKAMGRAIDSQVDTEARIHARAVRASAKRFKVEVIKSDGGGWNRYVSTIEVPGTFKTEALAKRAGDNVAAGFRARSRTGKFVYEVHTTKFFAVKGA